MSDDKKISELSTLSPVDDNDYLVVVDRSDTTMSVDGTTKKALKTEMKGDTGDAATLDVGTTTTGLPGTDASVVNSGSTSAAIFDFTIPRGDKGEKGDKGDTGATGSTGATGASIISADFDGDDIKFTKDDTNTVVLEDAKIELKGDTGLNGVGAIITATTATGASTAAKTATITDYTLAAGDLIALTLTSGNTAASMTLNINGGGALAIQSAGLAPTALTGTVTAGGTIFLYYTGTNFQMTGATQNTNTTYSEIPESEIDAGTATSARAISGRRAKYIIDKSLPISGGTLTGNLTAPTIKLTTGAGAGKVLTSDADGDATWETASAVPVKATGAELDTGTNDDKFATAKAIKDSHNVPSVAPGTSGNVLTSNGTDWTSAAPTAGSSVWTAVPGTPTRTANTTFTITGDYTALVTTGMVIKWTESSVVKAGLVLSSTYSSPNTTVTIVGDTMASIDASSCKYFNKAADVIHFAYAGTIGAVATDVMRAWYADKAYRVLGAKPSVGTAGTTNNTTFDININGTTAFTTKPTIATTAATGTIFTADNSKSLAINDKITIDVDAIQTTAAVDGYIDLFLLPTYYLSLT